MMTQDQKRSDTWTKRWRLPVVIIAFLVVAGLLLWVGRNGSTTGTASSTPGNTAVQTNEAGQVTISVTWQGKSAGPVFTVKMETHAVNLDSYDLRQLAVLRTDQGLSIQPNGWDAPAGGHHRSGQLAFPAKTASGIAVIGPNTHMLELIIRNVSGIPERSFRWTL